MKNLYWFIPVILFVSQAVYTFNSFDQIRFEELIESVQAPLWFSQGTVIAGTHTNIGWYAFLVSIYEIFGFSLNTPKLALLGLSLISLISLTIITNKYFDFFPGVIILLTLDLSPTLLFFTSQNLHLGVGLQMMPIFILLLMQLDHLKKWKLLIFESFIFFLAMIILLFYPPFVFYIPAITLFWLLKARKKRLNMLHFMAVAIFFLLPIIMGFFYIQNRELLIYDPETGTGMFRGGGRISFSADTFSQAWAGIINDFFIKPTSYHFEVSKVDFSDIFPLVTLGFVVLTTFQVYRREKGLKFLINLALVTMIFNLLIVSITSDYGIPGMKRSTPILASIYLFWVISWFYMVKWKNKLGMIILSLFFFHHLISYPINLSHLSNKSPFAENMWFTTQASPQQSLDVMLERLKREDITLDCRPFLTAFERCDLEFIYSALKSSCKWNNLDCHEIKGNESATGEYRELSVDSFK